MVFSRLVYEVSKSMQRMRISTSNYDSIRLSPMSLVDMMVLTQSEFKSSRIICNEMLQYKYI